MRQSNPGINASGMVSEKVTAGKLHAHNTPNILFEFKNANTIQFPGRMLDRHCNEPACTL